MINLSNNSLPNIKVNYLYIKKYKTQLLHNFLTDTSTKHLISKENKGHTYLYIFALTVPIPKIVHSQCIKYVY